MALTQQFGEDLLTSVIAPDDESDGEDVSCGADDNPTVGNNDGLPPIVKCHSLGH